MPMARTLIEVYLHIVFSSTTRRARCRLRRTSSLGLTMRPLRGRCVTAGGSAGHARARCTRPRATHGYFIDRSAVAEPDRSGSSLMATASRPARSTPLLAPDRNLCTIAPGSELHTFPRSATPAERNRFAVGGGGTRPPARSVSVATRSLPLAVLISHRLTAHCTSRPAHHRAGNIRISTASCSEEVSIWWERRRTRRDGWCWVSRAAR